MVVDRARLIGGIALLVLAALLFLLPSASDPVPVPIPIGLMAVGVALIAVARRRKSR